MWQTKLHIKPGESLRDRHLTIRFNEHVAIPRFREIVREIETWPEIDGVIGDMERREMKPYLTNERRGPVRLKWLADKIWVNFPSDIDRIDAFMTSDLAGPIGRRPPSI